MVERYEPDGEVGRTLRAAFEPRPEQVTRVVEEVLHAGEDGRRPAFVAAGAWVAFAVVLVLLLGAGVLLLRSLPAALPSEAVATSRYSLSNRDGLLVVRRLDDGATFLRSGERPSERPPGMMLIVRGETRP